MQGSVHDGNNQKALKKEPQDWIYVLDGSQQAVSLNYACVRINIGQLYRQWKRWNEASGRGAQKRGKKPERFLGVDETKTTK